MSPMFFSGTGLSVARVRGTQPGQCWLKVSRWPWALRAPSHKELPSHRKFPAGLEEVETIPELEGADHGFGLQKFLVCRHFHKVLIG